MLMAGRSIISRGDAFYHTGEHRLKARLSLPCSNPGIQDMWKRHTEALTRKHDAPEFLLLCRSPGVP